MACNTSLVNSYRIAPAGSDVTLSVSIGFGKTAQTAVMLNGTTVPGSPFTRDFSTVLKNVKDGDQLTMATAAGDTNIGSPGSSVTVSLSGGPGGPVTYPAMTCDTITGGAVDYDTSILFYKLNA